MVCSSQDSPAALRMSQDPPIARIRFPDLPGAMRRSPDSPGDLQLPSPEVQITSLAISIGLVDLRRFPGLLIAL